MQGEKLVSWINQTAEKTKFKGVELATVTGEYPDIRIRVDGMEHELGNGFLIIPSLFFSQKFHVSADWNLEGKTRASQTQSSSSHSHTIPQLNVENIVVEGLDTDLQCVLEVGDRIAVISAFEGNKYMILNKVVVT